MTDHRKLDSLHHVAISVNDISAAVDWYTATFCCEVTYQDESWAMLKFGNVSVALVLPEQHPPHLGFAVENAERFGSLKTHRDATRSVYVADPSGNAVELVDRDSLTESAAPTATALGGSH